MIQKLGILVKKGYRTFFRKLVQMKMKMRWNEYFEIRKICDI